MRRFILVISVCIVFASCVKKNRNVAKPKNFQLLKELSGSIDVNEVFSEFEYISLETTDQSILGSVDKLIVYEDKLFILDKAYSHKIFVFTKDGAFIRTIGKVGKGPGEYINIEDFTINENTKDIVILCYPSTVFVYNMKGEFVHQKKILSSAFVWNISYYNNKYICSSNHQSVLKGKEAFLLFSFDLDFNLQDKKLKVLPKQVTMPPLISNPILIYKDSFAYFDFFTSSLFYDNIFDSDFKSIHFDFGGMEVPIELYSNSQEFFSKQREYSFFLDAIIADKLFLSYYINEGKQNIFLLDFETNSTVAYKCRAWFPKLLFYRGGYYYSSMNPHWIAKGHNFFKAKLATKYPIKLNSNPVILRFKSKTIIKK